MFFFKNTAQIFLICLSFSLLFLFPKQTFAVAKFNTSYQIYYRLDASGTTHVTLSINQKNNLSVVYATDFGISINETKIDNVVVKDDGIRIQPEVNKTLNQTTISFPFQNKIVGKDKSHAFTIEYDTSDIATKFGNTWQINIPKLERDENIVDQTVILITPEGFSNPAYIDPKPDMVNGNNFYFSGSKIANKPISAIFGTSQYYKGSLVYHLSNTDPDNIRTEIALPPDTSYQTVYIEKISPKPDDIYLDSDGNTLAHYSLSPNQSFDVLVDFFVKINFTPKPSINFAYDDLLKANSIWNYENSIFNSPEISNLRSSKSIFDFVTDKLVYDYEKINRQKSLRVPAAESLLNFHSAICTDFTNLYVALSRKAGIPARELEGYAFSENPDLNPTIIDQDVLHAWPEYFNKSNNTWTQIDPTWTNTTRGIDYFNKLDFNHIVFVIHGKNPDYPVPAGGYKNGKIKSKDIVINPIDEIKFPNPEIKLSFLETKAGNAIFTINNFSGISYYATIKSEESRVLEKSESSISVAPYSKTNFSVKLKQIPFFGNKDSTAIIYINGQRFEQPIKLGSTSNQILIFTGIGIFLGFITLLSRNLYLRRQKQNPPIHW